MGQFRLPGIEPMAISKDERAFFQALGARIAQLRKQQSLTQAQLAEWLDVSQQTVNAYETGDRRVPASALPTLARRLGVSVEALIGEKPPALQRGRSPKLQQQLERLSRLPKSKQKFVAEMLDTVLSKTG